MPLLFASTSTGGNPNNTSLFAKGSNVTPGTTPIADVQSGTGCYYKEIYYNEYGKNFEPYPEIETNPGDYIFIFGCGDTGAGHADYVTSLSTYSTNKNLEPTDVLTFTNNSSKTFNVGVKYIMPSEDIQFNIVTEYQISTSSGGN